jgi:hypothetical protein
MRRWRPAVPGFEAIIENHARTQGCTRAPRRGSCASRRHTTPVRTARGTPCTDPCCRRCRRTATGRSETGRRRQYHSAIRNLTDSAAFTMRPAWRAARRRSSAIDRSRTIAMRTLHPASHREFIEGRRCSAWRRRQSMASSRDDDDNAIHPWRPPSWRSRHDAARAFHCPDAPNAASHPASPSGLNRSAAPRPVRHASLETRAPSRMRGQWKRGGTQRQVAQLAPPK